MPSIELPLYFRISRCLGSTRRYHFQFFSLVCLLFLVYSICFHLGGPSDDLGGAWGGPSDVLGGAWGALAASWWALRTSLGSLGGARGDLVEARAHQTLCTPMFQRLRFFHFCEGPGPSPSPPLVVRTPSEALPWRPRTSPNASRSLPGCPRTAPSAPRTLPGCP